MVPFRPSEKEPVVRGGTRSSFLPPTGGSCLLYTSWGKGLFGVSHQYVPKVHNDFILAFIGESCGYVGCRAVIALFGALCCKMLHNARRAEDSLGRLICVGVFTLILSLIHI